MSRWLVLALFAAALLACGPDTKHEILEKTESVETRQELEQALGPPDDRDKLGPIETWGYEASDGRVDFLITGDSVSLKSTSDAKTEEGEE
jgi:hypothetical protein